MGALVFNGLLKGYLNRSDLENAERVMVRMVEADVMPTATTYNILLKGYVDKGEIPKAEQVLQRMVDAKLKPGMLTYNILLDAYVKQNNPDKAEEIRQKMKIGATDTAADKNALHSTGHVLVSGDVIEEAEVAAGAETGAETAQVSE